MANFLVSFRIAYDDTYQDRYDSLKEQIDIVALDGVWEETSSVYVFQANGTADSVGGHLYMHSKLSAITDKLLVIELLNRTHVQYGCQYPHTLRTALGF